MLATEPLDQLIDGRSYTLTPESRLISIVKPHRYVDLVATFCQFAQHQLVMPRPTLVGDN